MAATAIHAVTSTEVKALKYITDPEKTENGRYVSNFACSNNPEKAAENFETVRANGTGRTTNLSFHYYQSFNPGEVNEEEALEIGILTAEKFLKEQYQYVIAVHNDRNHIHCHVIFNNTNICNGKSFESLENRGGHKWEKLREVSDQICLEHGLSVIENAERGKGKCWYEWQQDNLKLSWKSRLKLAIDECVMQSKDFDDFLRRMRERNIEVVYSPDKVINLKFRMPEQQRYSRARTLGWYYEVPQLVKRIRMFSEPEVSYTPVISSESKYSGTRFAELHNMKLASDVINMMSEYGVSNMDELHNLALTEHAKRSHIVGELNEIQNLISVKSEQITAVRKYEKYLSFHEEYRSLPSDSAKKKYAKKYTSELETFAGSRAALKEMFPDRTIDSSERLKKQRDALIEERNRLNKEYQESKSRSRGMDYCRKVLEDYLRAERDAREKKKQKNDLE